VKILHGSEGRKGGSLYETLMREQLLRVSSLGRIPGTADRSHQPWAMVILNDVNERLVEPGIACSCQMVCLSLPRKRKHAAFILG
jgi:hypothetical protein